MKDPVYALWAQEPPYPGASDPHPVLLGIFLDRTAADEECARVAAQKTNQLNGITFYVEELPVEQ